MTKFLIALATLTSVSAYAGDNGGGRISCASDSGRTVVEGSAGAPYNGSGSALLSYTIDGSKVELNTYKLAGPTTHVVDFVSYNHKKSYEVVVKTSNVFNEGNGTATVYNDQVFQMRSIAGTMTQVHPDVFRFKALIPAYSSIDPRKGTDLSQVVDRFDQDIQLNCELDVTL